MPPPYLLPPYGYIADRDAGGLCCGADTSLTNFFAFMLGTTSSLPVVEYFCLYAGTAILFDFFLQARDLFGFVEGFA